MVVMEVVEAEVLCNGFSCVPRGKFAVTKMVNGLQSSTCAPEFREHVLLLLISTRWSTAVTRGQMLVSGHQNRKYFVLLLLCYKW